MNLAVTGGSTPRSEWIAPPAWWAGVDPAGGQGDHHNREDYVGRSGRSHGQQKEQKELSSQASSNGRRQYVSTVASFEPENRVQVPFQRERVVGRDPRKMFGDLPNSSFDINLLGDPIKRELDQRGEFTAEKNIPLRYCN